MVWGKEKQPDEEAETPPAPLTLDEVNADLQQHKRETRKRLDAQEQQIKEAADGVRRRLDNLDAVLTARQSARKKDAALQNNATGEPSRCKKPPRS